MSERKVRRAVPGPPYYPLMTVAGSRGAGKSATVEDIDEVYYRRGYIVMDLWASLDRENAYWCIPDLYPINWNLLPGKHELRLFMFCRLKYGLDWFEVVPNPQKKGSWIRKYKISKPDSNTIVVTSLDGKHRLTLTMSQDGRAMKVHFAGIEKFPGSLKTFDVWPDVNGSPKIRFPNPKRDGSENRTAGYPIVIVLPDTTTIIQHTPLCICGKPLAWHEEQDFPCKKKEPLIKTVQDTTPLAQILKMAMAERRVVVFNRGFYDLEEQTRAYGIVHMYIQELPFLVNRKVIPTDQAICISLRELGSLIPKKMKTIKGGGVTEVKRVLQYFLNEARHFRTTIIVDYQAGDEILGEVVSKKDIALIKKSSKDILPASHQWVYDEIVKKHFWALENYDDDDDQWPLIEDLRRDQVYVVYPDGYPRYELRTTGMPDFKHKESHDDWEYLADCTIHFDVDAIKAKHRKGGRNKPKDEIDILRDRALEQAVKLKEEHPDWDNEKLCKEVGFVDRRTGKLASPDTFKVNLHRFVKRKEQVGAGQEEGDDSG